MGELHLPWLTIATLLPLVGAFVVGQLKDVLVARRWSLAVSAGTFGCAVGAWIDFILLGQQVAHDRWDLTAQWLGAGGLAIDELNAPLLGMSSLLYLLIGVATPGTKVRRYSFAANLVSESLLLATFCCRAPWGIVVLLALGTLPPMWELRTRRKPIGVYLVHMAAFIVLLAAGWWIISHDVPSGSSDTSRLHSVWALAPLLLAVLIRCGIAPFHCWVTDLFEHASFGAALVFVTPMAGVYAAVRLILPNASDEVLHLLGLVSLGTAVYAAGMALVQREARRFFCYILLSHSALVLVGLQTVTPIGLTAALSLWLSMGLSLTGFGVTLRALEARHGRLSLAGYHGVYEHTPMLAICFLLTGLASVGFPGTFGFVGTELLVDGAIETFPYVGMAVVIAAALNGIAVVQAYFRLFTGTRHVSSVPLQVSWREQFAVLTLAALILGGGLFPQPGVVARHHAAQQLLGQRQEGLTPPVDMARSWHLRDKSCQVTHFALYLITKRSAKSCVECRAFTLIREAEPKNLL
jgi:NADH-quinone oxidoreductase subunit M